jgi:hypothetical protein
MDTKNLISIQQFCTHYNVPKSFIDSLCEYELIEIVNSDNSKFISVAQIKNIEKLMRFHFDLEINIEGIHAICNLLDQVETLQQEIRELKNRLIFYEDK